MGKPKFDPATLVPYIPLVVLGVVAIPVVRAFMPEKPDTIADSVNPEEEDDDATFSRERADNIADRIFAAIYGDGTFFGGQTGEDEEAVVDAMQEVQVNADFRLLVDAYGIRGGAWSMAGNLALPPTLREYLSASDLQAINADYQSKGITFRV